MELLLPPDVSQLCDDVWCEAQKEPVVISGVAFFFFILPKSTFSVLLILKSLSAIKKNRYTIVILNWETTKLSCLELS